MKFAPHLNESEHNGNLWACGFGFFFEGGFYLVLLYFHFIVLAYIHAIIHSQFLIYNFFASKFSKWFWEITDSPTPTHYAPTSVTEWLSYDWETCHTVALSVP